MFETRATKTRVKGERAEWRRNGRDVLKMWSQNGNGLVGE